MQISRNIVHGPKVIIRFWWGSGLSSASKEPSHHFLQTFRLLRMFKIVFHDGSLYHKQLPLFCLLMLISASADSIGYITNFGRMIELLHELKNSSF